MFRLIPFVLLVLSFVGCNNQPATKNTFDEVAQQLELLHTNVLALGRDGKWFPRTLRNDSLRLVVSNDWTSGFFPGMLWMMYEYSQDEKWKTRAVGFTERMTKEPFNAGSHDVGFKVYNSFGQAYRLTKGENYKRAIIQAAGTLSSRFDSTIGCIRSWDFGDWQYPVIIDNMMNLELLFAATKLSGDSSFYQIAVTHAHTTMRNHFRNDFSSYHVIDYDTLTGKPLGGSTHQGFADSSAWARGQAWALYGYTMCFRETKDTAFLVQAENIASFILDHPNLPKDKIPYWDFDAPVDATTARDVSAAAIMGSALFELSQYSSRKDVYMVTAKEIAQTLTHSYRSKKGTNQGFILDHSTGHLPAGGEIDVPIIYADYYYLELLMRLKSVGTDISM